MNNLLQSVSNCTCFVVFIDFCWALCFYYLTLKMRITLKQHVSQSNVNFSTSYYNHIPAKPN